MTNYEDALDKAIFKLGLQIKRQLSDLSSSEPKDLVSSGVKLLRIEVSTFDGNIVNWIIFWKQFEAAIHSYPFTLAV